jgi:exopolyphosphatase/guanosine-5'-triphosphate,3'-diphosphate pyrophosphatase
MGLFAAVDLGSNTFRLLLAEVESPSSLRTVEIRQKVVRLAEGMAKSGVLSEAALARATSCLEEFSAFLDGLGVENRVAALAASGRRASNGEKFRAEAERILGGRVIIPTGREEALLSCKGALSLCPGLGEEILFLDIGGGSTEIVREKKGEETLAESIPLGIVGFWEELGLPESLTAQDRVKLTEAARAAVSGFPPPEVFSVDFRRGKLVATAGTAMTLAALFAKVDIANVRELCGVEIPLAFARSTLVSLSEMLSAERRAQRGVEPGREDLVLGGIALLVALMERYGAESFTASDGGLAEGLLLKTFAG